MVLKYYVIGAIFTVIILVSLGFFIMKDKNDAIEEFTTFTSEENKVQLYSTSTKGGSQIGIDTYDVSIDNGLKISYEDWYVTFQPQFVINNGQVYSWNQIPAEINKNIWKKQISPFKYKYGVDFSNVPDNIRYNLEYIVLHRENQENITFNDVSLLGNSIRIRDRITLSHNDLLRTYSIPKINRTDIVIGGLNNSWEICDTIINEYEECGESHLEGNWIDNGDGTWNLSLDPTVVIDGDVSYPSIDDNRTQQIGFSNQKVINDSLNTTVARYGFDFNTSSTTVYDETVWDNDLTNNGAVFNETGYIGGSYSFDGASSLNRAGADLVGFNTSSITISAWTYVTVMPTGNFQTNYIVARFGNTGDRQFHMDILRWGTGSFTIVYRCVMNNATGSNRVRVGVNDGSDDVVPNEWHHVACTWDAETGNVTTWLDGAVYVTDIETYPGPIWNGNTELTIGSNALDTRYWEGNLDEVVAFNRSLNDSEMQQLYKSGLKLIEKHGTHLFNNTNVSDGSGTENRLNISLADYKNYLGANVSVNVNGTFYNLSQDGTVNNLRFTEDPNKLNITFLCTTNSTQFKGCLMIGNITTVSWAFVADSCTYASGNWNIDCSDQCNITSQVNLAGNNITASGIGNVRQSQNITGVNYHFLFDPCNWLLLNDSYLFTG